MTTLISTDFVLILTPVGGRLCFAHRAHIQDRLLAGELWLVNLNLCDVALITCDVLLQREQQTLGVLRGENHATLDIRLLHTGQYCREVDDELRRRVCDNRQIRDVSPSPDPVSETLPYVQIFVVQK